MEQNTPKQNIFKVEIDCCASELLEQAVLILLLLKITPNREEGDSETVNLPLSIIRAAAFIYLSMLYFCSLIYSEHLDPSVWHSVISSQYILISYVVCSSYPIQNAFHLSFFSKVNGL